MIENIIIQIRPFLSYLPGRTAPQQIGQILPYLSYLPGAKPAQIGQIWSALFYLAIWTLFVQIALFELDLSYRDSRIRIIFIQIQINFILIGGFGNLNG